MSQFYTRVKLFNRECLTRKEPLHFVVDQLLGTRDGIVGVHYNNNESANMIVGSSTYLAIFS